MALCIAIQKPQPGACCIRLQILPTCKHMSNRACLVRYHLPLRLAASHNLRAFHHHLNLHTRQILNLCIYRTDSYTAALRSHWNWKQINMARLAKALYLDQLAQRPSHEGSDTVECPICHEVAADPRETPCKHVFCLRCLTQWVEGNRPRNSRCPICRTELYEPLS